MRLKNDTNNYAASFNITPPYQMLVLHSKVLIYPREIYQRGECEIIWTTREKPDFMRVYAA